MWTGIIWFLRWVLELFLFWSAVDLKSVVHFGQFERTTIVPLAKLLRVVKRDFTFELCEPQRLGTRRLYVISFRIRFTLRCARHEFALESDWLQRFYASKLALRVQFHVFKQIFTGPVNCIALQTDIQTSSFRSFAEVFRSFRWILSLFIALMLLF